LLLVQTIIDTVIQIILFSAIPLFWWLFSARKKERFLLWIGLTKPKFNSRIKSIVVSLISFFLLLSSGLFLLYSFEDKSLLANAKYAGLGISGVPPILIYSVFQTGLCEEILFRGFLNKRFSIKFGNIFGNIAQATLFGLLHGVLLFGNISAITVIIAIIFSSIAGWFMGYLNENLGNGSIIPSWIIHSLINISSSFMFLFGVIAV